MILRLPAFRFSPGFTLVELLVVLAIMVGLVTVTSVSVGTTQDKARADKTAAIGRQVVEDLERSDRLSFVSDFGRLPQSADEVKFLFSRSFIDSGEVNREAANHQFRTLVLPGSLPVGAPPGSGTKLSDAFGVPVLGVGWRGPYSVVTELDHEDGEPSEFLDGWKNEWEVSLEGGSFSGLRSLGRDGRTGGVEWQDKDLDFPLHRSVESVDLQGQVIVRAADGNEYTTEGQFTDFTLRVVYFTPEFDPNFPLNATTENVATVEFTWNGVAWENPARTEQASANPFQFRLSGLTAGHRAFFIYAFGTPTTEVDKALYGGGVRLVHVEPGTNRMEFRLTEL